MDQTNRAQLTPFIPNPANPDFPPLPTPSSSIYPSRSQIDPMNLWAPPARSGLHFQVSESPQGLPLHALCLKPHASPRPPPPHTLPCLFTLAPSPLSFRCPNSIPISPPPPLPQSPPLPLPPPPPPPPPPYPRPLLPPPPSSSPLPMGANTRSRSIHRSRKVRHAAKHQPSSSYSRPVAAPPLACSFFPYPSLSRTSADGDPATGQPPLNSNLNPSHAYDYNDRGYCIEEQLKELLLKNLDFVYREALNSLITLGYNEEAVLRAMLCSGYWYASMDALSNILQNALAHLSSPMMAGDCDTDSSIPVSGFTDLRHLQEYSLAKMVCLLQQIRPHLNRGDAMWHLLMSDLHVGHASSIDIALLTPSTTPYPTPTLVPIPDFATGCGTTDGAD